MALVRTGSVVGAISGALGSVVFSRQGGSAVVRNRPLYVRKDTARLQEVRCRMGLWRRYWELGTDEQRRQWQVAAEQWSATNRVGVSRKLSGRTFFLMMRLRELGWPADPWAVGSVALGVSDAVPVLRVYPGGPMWLEVVSPTAQVFGTWKLFLQRTFRTGSGLPGRLMAQVLNECTTDQAYGVALTGANGFCASPVVGERFRWRAYTAAAYWPTKLEYWGLAEVEDVGPELCVNGDMETVAGGVPTGWAAAGTGAVLGSTTAGEFCGVYSALLTKTGAASTFQLQSPVFAAATAVATYTVRFAAKLSAGALSSVFLYKSGVLTNYVTGWSLPADGMWHRCVSTVACTAAATGVKLYFQFSNQPALDFWLDNVSVRRVL